MISNKFLCTILLLLISFFSINIYAQELEPSYNPFTGQPNNINNYVIYSTAPHLYTNYGHYNEVALAKDPYSFCYHNGKAYSEGAKIKHKKCVKSGFPNTPMSWE